MLVQHLFSVVEIPRGWRPCVLELFNEMKWSEEEWSVFDEVGSRR